MNLYETTDELTDQELLAKAQELRSRYPDIIPVRGFGVVNGMIVVNANEAPQDTGLTWVKSELPTGILIRTVEEEVKLEQ